MKKIIVGIFSFALLFVAQNAFAATWNGASNDCRGISIVNSTTNEGYAHPCWPSSAVSADAGDTLNIRIYYHNTGTTTANNTRITLNAPVGGSASFSKSFSGNISSDQGSLSLSTVTANLSSSQIITFNSVKWYTNNTSETLTALPGGQSGSEILSGGLNLGSIAPGWETQGSLVISFHVSNTVAPEHLPYTITATAGPGGTISPAGITSYTYPDNSKWFTILPSTGYHALDVLIDGESIGPTSVGYGFYGIVANHTIHATFEKNAEAVVPACVISSFLATPPSIVSGGSSSLSWGTSNCTNVNISNLGSNLAFSSAGQPVHPTNTTTYVLTATGASGAQTRSATVTVTEPVVETYKIDATASAGGTITSPGITTFKKGEVKYYYFNPTFGYHIADVLVDGVSVASAKTSGLYYFPNITANHAIIVTFAANQVAARNCSTTLSTSNPSITRGESATLTWTLTDCVDAELWPIVGPKSSSGSQAVYPTSSTTYTLTAYNLSNSTSSYGSRTAITKTVTITVKEPVVPTCQNPLANNIGGALPCTFNTPANIINDSYNVINSNNNTLIVNPPVNPVNPVTPVYNRCIITNFSASDTNIEEGDSSTLRWNTDNCERVRISNISGTLSDDGSRNVYPTYDTTYTITAYDANGSSQTDSIKIYVNDDNYNYNDNCSIDSFTTNTTSINQGNPVTIRWNTSNCTYINISNLGNVYSSGSQTFYPSSSINYILTARGSNGGTQTRSLWVNVNQTVNPTPVPVYNKCAVTTVATNVNQSGAQLNGIITSSTGGNTYFEYGTTVNLGYRTASRFVNGNVNFSDFVSGLAPNTIYFFRMVSDCQNGVSQGALEVFRTLPTQSTGGSTVKTVVVQGTTVTGIASPVLLNITNKYELIGVGDLIDYVVTYKNVGNARITRPMIQVMLPANVTLVNASRGTYEVDTKTLSAPLADLLAGEEGVIYIQARVDTIPLNNAQIVTTAIMVYTNASNTQENVMAYVFNMPKFMMVSGTTTDGSVLGASAFFAGLMSIGLIGWLLILLLILIIVLIAKSYSRNNTSTDSKTITHTTTH